jgi:hypothetical protein
MVADSQELICSKCHRVIVQGEVFQAAMFNPNLLEHVDCSKGPEVFEDEEDE